MITDKSIKGLAEETTEHPNIQRWYNRGMGCDQIKKKLVREFGYSYAEAKGLINRVIYEEE